MSARPFFFRAIGLLVCLWVASVWAQAESASQTASAAQLQAWLTRMHEGSRSRAYVGTFVVSAGSHLSSARIWHVCEGSEQVERVDSLTGVSRSVFRHNDQVLTVWPDSGRARSERRESLGLFPDRLRTADGSLAEHYRLEIPGLVERVAGVPAVVVLLQPRDALRFGYRLWLEQQSGLVLKLQTLDHRGHLLEQAAFSELQLDAPLKAATLLRLMNQYQGLTLEKPQPVKTTLAAEGWRLKQAVPGFKALSCHRRPVSTAAPAGLHCVFSDGLASVSVFLSAGAASPQPLQPPGAMGATHALRARLQQHSATFMGEVPPATLERFAAALERGASNP
jgi:sigma-E factor negative regulatory protein RseB